MSKRMKRLIWIAPAAIVGMAVFIAIGGEIVMLLWNWLTPALFGWRLIGFWQAVGLLALCRILFGGLGRMGYGRRSHRRWKLGERLEELTPEEREKLRQAFESRWGRVPPPESKPGS